MRKSFFYTALFATLSLLLSGCGGGALDRAIKQALVQGDTTAERLDDIVALITADKDSYGHLLAPDGTVDYQSLDTYVNDMAAKMRPPMHWNVAALAMPPLQLSIYLERSGSMVPYDRPGGRGLLKASVNDLINAFPGKCDDVSLHIVNNDIYPYQGSIDDFLQDRDIYASTAGVGNPAYTDFGRILDRILSTQGPSEVSVLVTDLIYSPADTKDLSIDKLLNEERSLVASTFKKHEGKSVLVHQCVGDFDGKYYTYRGGAVDYRGERPYYLLFIASTPTLERYVSSKGYAAAIASSMPRHRYWHGRAQQPVDWVVVPDWSDNAGRWRVSHDDHTRLTGVLPDRTTGVLRFTLAANLGALLLDDTTLTDSTAYTVSSLTGFTLSVRRIEQGDITANNRPYLEGKTHLLTLTGAITAPRDEVTIALPNDLPEWSTACNATDDTQPTPTTTLGLVSFMAGLKTALPGDDNYFTLHIKLEK